MRVEGGEASLKTRKGLDWTNKFKAIAKEGSALPDVLIDGEIVALDHDGKPHFSTLQAAIADGKTENLIFFAFDLLFADGMDLRRLRRNDLGATGRRLPHLAGVHGAQLSRGVRRHHHDRRARLRDRSSRRTDRQARHPLVAPR